MNQLTTTDPENGDSENEAKSTKETSVPNASTPLGPLKFAVPAVMIVALSYLIVTLISQDSLAEVEQKLEQQVEAAFDSLHEVKDLESAKLAVEKLRAATKTLNGVDKSKLTLEFNFRMEGHAVGLTVSNFEFTMEEGSEIELMLAPAVNDFIKALRSDG